MPHEMEACHGRLSNISTLRLINFLLCYLTFSISRILFGDSRRSSIRRVWRGSNSRLENFRCIEGAVKLYSCLGFDRRFGVWRYVG